MVVLLTARTEIQLPSGKRREWNGIDFLVLEISITRRSYSDHRFLWRHFTLCVGRDQTIKASGRLRDRDHVSRKRSAIVICKQEQFVCVVVIGQWTVDSALHAVGQRRRRPTRWCSSRSCGGAAVFLLRCLLYLSEDRRVVASDASQ